MAEITTPYLETFEMADREDGGLDCWFACNICGRNVDDTPCPEHGPGTIPGLRVAECDATPPHPVVYSPDRDDYGFPCPRRAAAMAEATVADFAQEAAKHLAENFPENDLLIQQVLCLAEEAGEFVGAYRRWAGLARRTGSFADVCAELADVVITAYVTAVALDIDLDAAIREKTSVISTRGWRERPADGGDGHA